MKIGFVGIGNVGGTLARKLGAKGHSIFLGTRDPSNTNVLSLAKDIGSHASVHTAAEAAALSEVIILATPWNASELVVKELSKSLENKILIDCTNPLKNDLSGLEIGFDNSGGETVQQWAPKSLVYKCFNTTGFNIMADPALEGRKSMMFFCSDDRSHRHKIAGLVEDVGFEAIDVGPLTSSRLLEPWALLWIQCAYKFGMGRDFGFGVLRKDSQK